MPQVTDIIELKKTSSEKKTAPQNKKHELQHSEGDVERSKSNENMLTASFAKTSSQSHSEKAVKFNQFLHKAKELDRHQSRVNNKNTDHLEHQEGINNKNLTSVKIKEPSKQDREDKTKDFDFEKTSDANQLALQNKDTNAKENLNDGLPNSPSDASIQNKLLHVQHDKIKSPNDDISGKEISQDDETNKLKTIETKAYNDFLTMLNSWMQNRSPQASMDEVKSQAMNVDEKLKLVVTVNDGADLKNSLEGGLDKSQVDMPAPSLSPEDKNAEKLNKTISDLPLNPDNKKISVENIPASEDIALSPTLKLNTLQAMLQKIEKEMGIKKIPEVLEKLLSNDKDLQLNSDPDLQKLLQSVIEDQKNKKDTLANVGNKKDETNLTGNLPNTLSQAQILAMRNNSPKNDMPLPKSDQSQQDAIQMTMALMSQGIKQTGAKTDFVKHNEKNEVTPLSMNIERHTNNRAEFVREKSTGQEEKNSARDGASASNNNVLNNIVKNNKEEITSQFNQIFDGARGVDKSATGSLEKLVQPHLHTADTAIVQEIARKMLGAVMKSQHEVHIQLRPEQLGRVHVAIEKQNDQMHAKISVENENVKKIVEANLSQLKDSLSNQGVTMQNLEVSVNLLPREDNGGQENRSQDQNLPHSHSQNHPNQNTPLWNGPESISEGDTGRRLGYNTLEFIA